MTYGVEFTDANGDKLDLTAGTWFPHDGQTVTAPASPNTTTLSYPELAGDELRVQVIPAAFGVTMAGMFSYSVSGTDVIVGSNTSDAVELHVFVFRKGITL
jgi:hypothetical protein